ncbi:hypothetical protein [Actinomadura mexicana]|uniref:Transposase, YhgA-like n=1 Tax=Actinomadura mexicana TaxID=134959 RepID=A0A239BAX3_9ACTN|nr:hypothetical protein [Actinomadura mexicana]SNS04324.1 hypothetical protein SAMN06265355_11051 [Actinomadura mexicana]
MVTVKHEGPIQIIRDNPEVVAQLLKSAFGVEVSDAATIRSTSETCTQLAPTAYVADNVVEICEGGSTEPTIGVVAETQLAKDPDKHGSWPVYLATLHAKLMCPCYLLVICPSRPVAEWARQAIQIGHPGFNLAPYVIGPGMEPLVTTPDQAAQMPEMTVLAALANIIPTDEESLKITHAALATISNENQKIGDLYTGLVVDVLSKTALKILEGYVDTGIAGYKYKSNTFRRLHAEGKAEGEVRGEAESVLKVLDARGLSVPDEVREQILACTDRGQLDRWLVRAATAEHADHLFG